MPKIKLRKYFSVLSIRTARMFDNVIQISVRCLETSLLHSKHGKHTFLCGADLSSAQFISRHNYN